MSISVNPPITNGEYKGEVMDAIPKPARSFEAKLLDFNGDTIRPVKTTFMARLDKAGSEKVEVSRNTIWLCGTALVLLGVIFSYGSSMLGWIRADEGIRVNQSSMQKDMDEMRMDMKELKAQFTELQKLLQAQAVKDAEQKGKALGYDVGRTDKTAGH